MSTHVLSEAEVNALRNPVPIGPGTMASSLATYQPAQVVAPAMAQEAWTQERLELLKKTYCQGATDAEFELFVGNCKRLRLSPEARQIWSVPRRQKDPNTDQYVTVRQTMVSIDGLRLIAERTGRYEGQTRTEWCGKDGLWKEVWLEAGPPAAARVGVFKAGFREPLYRVARYAAFCDERSPMWRKMGDHMVAKVAEALAIRAAFPQETSGAYTDDEMGQAGDGTPEVKAEVIESKPVASAENQPQRLQDNARASAGRASDRPDTRAARKAEPKSETGPEDTSPVVGGRGPHAGKRMSVLSDSELIDIVRQMMHVAATPKWAAEMAPKIAAAKAYAATRNIVDFSVSKEERAKQLAAAVKGQEHEYSDEMYMCENHGMYGNEPGMDDVDIRKWLNPEKLVEYINWLRATYNQPTQTGRIACAEKCLEKLVKDEAARAEKALAKK